MVLPILLMIGTQQPTLQSSCLVCYGDVRRSIENSFLGVYLEVSCLIENFPAYALLGEQAFISLNIFYEKQVT